MTLRTKSKVFAARKTRNPARATSSWLLPAVIVLSCAAIAGLWAGRLFAPDRPATATRAGATNDRRDFSLTDTSGQKVSLATYRGKWLLMYFGFTNCPEACPLALNTVAAALKAMGASAMKPVPIFVTVDPDRDTPATLKDYLANFGDGFVGLSGTADETAAIAKAYGVYYKKDQSHDGGYTVDHSSAFYLISPSGDFIKLLSANRTAGVLAGELQSAISNGRTIE